MSHVSSRDPRLKQPQIVVHVLSDDEDDASEPRKFLATNEVIDLDSESDNEDQDNTFKQMDGSKVDDIGPAESFEPAKDFSLGGYAKQDGDIQMHKDERCEPDQLGESMRLREADEYSMLDEDSEELEQDYDYEADYLLGGPMEVQRIKMLIGF
jgi:hypothetical protein